MNKNYLRKKRYYVMGLLFVALAYWCGQHHSATTKDLLNDNIEALSDGEGIALPVECYDQYRAYSSTSARRFRPCDTDGCSHIWAYRPSKKTICRN